MSGSEMLNYAASSHGLTVAGKFEILYYKIIT